MHIAVLGASGRTGRATVAHALAAGHTVAAVVRNPANAPAGTRVNVADARDVPALIRAMEGVDAVVSCLGHVTGDADDTILADGTAAVIEAMAAAGVDRLVAVSAAGAFVAGDDPISHYIAKPLVARLFGPTADTRVMEAVVRASDTRWTLLRPSRLVKGQAKKRYRSRIDVAIWWHYKTAFGTVGRAAVDALTTSSWVGHAVFLTE